MQAGKLDNMLLVVNDTLEYQRKYGYGYGYGNYKKKSGSLKRRGKR
jgi:hypothetical protein